MTGSRRAHVNPKSADRPLLELPDRAALRAWLAHNHESSTGMRVAVSRKGHSATELTYEDTVLEALCFGWIDGTGGKLDDDRYVVGLTPRRPKSNWARSNKARVETLIAEGLMMPAGLAAIERAKANGSWETSD